MQKLYDWDIGAANKLFAFAGACSLITFYLLMQLSNQLSDRMLTLSSLLTGLVGYLCLTFPLELSVVRFLTGFGLISTAFPMGRASVIALYTKLLPRERQGSGQGIILAIGAIARIVGPFWGVGVVQGAGSGVMTGTAILFGSCAVGFLSMWSRFNTDGNWSKIAGTVESVTRDDPEIVIQ